MNRILTADVIITLTAEQADQLMRAVASFAAVCADTSNSRLLEANRLLAMLHEQCAKQGVSL